MPVARKRFTVADAPDTLPDGAILHVPAQEMRDSATRFGGPLIINSGMRLDREFYPDGTPKNVGDEPEARRRRKVQYRTAEGFEGGTYEEGDAAYASHRPGFRDANRSASETARAQLINDTANAWRSPETLSRAGTTFSDAPPAGVDPREFAWAQNVRATADAWRTPPVALDANGSEVAATTRAMPNRPKDAWGPAGYGAKAGDPCMSNAGEAGVLEEANGWLYCRVSRLGPTRSGKQSAGDVPVTRVDSVTDQAQAIRDEAYKPIAPSWRALGAPEAKRGSTWDRRNGEINEERKGRARARRAYRRTAEKPRRSTVVATRGHPR